MAFYQTFYMIRKDLDPNLGKNRNKENITAVATLSPGSFKEGIGSQRCFLKTDLCSLMASACHFGGFHVYSRGPVKSRA